MEALNRKIDSWVHKHLIPQLVKDESNVEFSVERPSGNYYLSDPFFVTLRSPKIGKKSMLIKIPSQHHEFSKAIDYDTLFANEISFYKEISCGDSQYPQCYLAGKDPVFKAIIALEDVRPRGYAVSPNKVNVHLDYIVAALKAIARFHALTYSLKEKEPDKFSRLVKSMHDSRFQETPLNERFALVINNGCRRVLDKIRARTDNSALTEKMCNLFDDAFVSVMIKSAKPVEPLATIVHGDCTINNILYRWEKKNNNEDSELEAMLIDFGLLMYSSPTLDLSILFYMTCTREDIRDRAKYLLEVYHSSLSEYMKERGIWDASKYSLENFWRDYRRCAVFGYLIAAFFRGMMTAFDHEHDIVQVESMVDWHAKDGGDEALTLLVDMLDDMRDAGMLEHYIGK